MTGVMVLAVITPQSALATIAAFGIYHCERMCEYDMGILIGDSKMKKFVKVVGSDGFDTILCNGCVVFFGPPLSVSAWVEKHDVFISDVIEG